MKNIYKLFVLIFLLLFPTFVWAVSTSENYQLEGDIDNGGNFSSSETYQAVGSINGESVNSTSLDFNNQSTIDNTTNTPSQSIVDKITTSISNIIDSITNQGFVEAVTSNKTVSENKNTLAITVAALTGAVAAIPLAANIPISYSLGNLISSIFPFLGRRKKTQNWGLVYDAESHQGVSRGVVRIINWDTKKVLETKITDKDGRFDLMIAPGEYYFEVFKENYFFPSKIINTDYHGGSIRVEQNKEIRLSIPIDPKLSHVTSFVNSVWNFKKILEFIYFPMLFIGTILSIIFYIKYQDLSNLLVLILYLIIFVYEYYKNHKARPYGLVFDQANKNPLNLTIVRIFDNLSGKLITTKVSDIKGKFVFLVNHGQYYLTAVKQGYSQYKSNSLDFKTNTLVNIDIPLSKE